MKIISISQLPPAGLGNKLFSWASGVVFSYKNQCKHIVLGMTRFHLGPIIRGERSSRFYWGYLQNERMCLPLSFWFITKKRLKQQEADQIVTQDGVYLFSEIPHWRDYFITLRDHRSLIVSRFWQTLNSRIATRIQEKKAPIIGVHIRMGDFRELQANEDFANLGLVRTPLGYFSTLIKAIRQVAKQDLPVTIFSDGYDEELEEVLSLPKVNRAEDDLDIVHLAWLSRSKIIIMSAGSSFSYWAGFLSDGVLIKHYQHIHAPIRPKAVNKKVYEGGIDPDIAMGNYPQLVKNIKDIAQTHRSL